MKPSRADLEIVGTAVRMELQDDELYLVFQITNQEFKQQIRQDWMTDVELEIVGKNLIKLRNEDI